LAEEGLNGKQKALIINATLMQTIQSLSRGIQSYAFSISTKHAKRSLSYSQDFQIFASE